MMTTMIMVMVAIITIAVAKPVSFFLHIPSVDAALNQGSQIVYSLSR